MQSTAGKEEEDEKESRQMLPLGTVLSRPAFNSVVMWKYFGPHTGIHQGAL